MCFVVKIAHSMPPLQWPWIITTHSSRLLPSNASVCVRSHTSSLVTTVNLLNYRPYSHRERIMRHWALSPTACYIDITNFWTSIGRPRCGEINAERLRCKFRYKQAIKEAANEAEQCMNNDPFSHLCSKDTVSFWKSSRKRFCSRNVQPTNVLNVKSGDDIFTWIHKLL